MGCTMTIVPRASGWDLQASDPGAAEVQRSARRNLWLSVPALALAFAVWMLWSVIVVHLPAAGFHFSTMQLFWLTAMPALCGATLRVFYAFALPRLGGRRFAALSTASLLVPALGAGLAVQEPRTPYELMVLLALLCGLGGANFVSSMARIGRVFPRTNGARMQALGASLGSLGLPLMQALAPLAVAAGVFGALGGPAQASAQGAIWLQNAGFVWAPLILASALAAWWGMGDRAASPAPSMRRAVIFRRRHNWLMSWLYAGSFGTFIGHAACLPLLVHVLFPGVDALQFAWLGPLAGTLARPAGGWLADRRGGARTTQGAFMAMVAGVLVVLQGLPPSGGNASHGGSLAVVMAGYLLLFAAAGVGNGSIFRMIPAIFLRERTRAAARHPWAQARAASDAGEESDAALAFASAVGAYGGFFVPALYGASIALGGGPGAALYLLIAGYAVCIAITWWFYGRRFAPMPC
jgi:NNP family nitrate/nitrite transporter-like MFS transporter